MQDFPANSAKARVQSDGPTQEPKNLGQVTSASVERRKPKIGRKFKETFVGGSARMAVDYMILEVVIPAVQDTLIDAFQGGVERWIRGEGSRSRRSVNTTSYSGLGHVNYGGMSSNKPSTVRSISPQARSRHDFGDIVIQSRAEAEEVLERLFDVLGRYGMVPVADLYELTGIQSGHTDHKWGWTSLRGAKVRSVRGGGYLLDLPNPEPLG